MHAFITEKGYKLECAKKKKKKKERKKEMQREEIKKGPNTEFLVSLFHGVMDSIIFL